MPDTKSSTAGETAPRNGQGTRQDGGGAVDENYLQELGSRVRRIRAIRGMSRKVLAQVSGISERYIAQLESGMGNVSIILLRRIARATGVRLEDLVTDAPESWTSIRDLLPHASEEQIARSRAILTGQADFVGPAEGAQPQGLPRVALIGLRGAGKSTLGKLAADRLGVDFVELNREIETEHGLSVTEIFKLYGQDGYRRLELASLRRIVARPDPFILATGGGIVAESVAFNLLLAAFFTVWIKALPAEHMNRVRQQGDLRPMANDRAAMEELITILSSREPLYARAQAQLDTAGRPLDECVAELVGTIKGHYHAQGQPAGA